MIIRYRMRLFLALCRYRKTPNGNIYTGKHRLVKPVEFADKQKLKDQLEMEERNMFYLRHPYLTTVRNLIYTELNFPWSNIKINGQ